MDNRFMRALLLLTALSCAPAVSADGEFIDVAPRNAAEITLILNTLQAAVEDQSVDSPPIVMMLHGPAAHLFMRSNYGPNRGLVDQTAALSSYGILQVQVCEVWLGNNGYAVNDLFPFISPVPYGAAELQRLQDDEGFSEFSIDL